MKLIRQYAGGHKVLIPLGRTIAGISAVMALVPYYDLWKIISIAVNGEDTGRISHYAWQAVIITIASLLVYIVALLCTHIAAFRVQANMRSSLMRRIITLPLGVFDEDGTGSSGRIGSLNLTSFDYFVDGDEIIITWGDESESRLKIRDGGKSIYWPENDLTFIKEE